MAIDRYPSFDNLASLATYLLNSVEDLLEVRGFVVDRRKGIVIPPDEFRNGNVTEIYSEEVKQQFKSSVETALVMSMQLMLLARLSDHFKEENLQALVKKHQTAVNAATSQGVYPLLGLVDDLKPRLFSLFQTRPLTPIEEAVYQVLTHHRHELNKLTSLDRVNELMTKIELTTEIMPKGPSKSQGG